VSSTRTVDMASLLPSPIEHRECVVAEPVGAFEMGLNDGSHAIPIPAVLHVKKDARHVEFRNAFAFRIEQKGKQGQVALVVRRDFAAPGTDGPKPNDIAAPGRSPGIARCVVTSPAPGLFFMNGGADDHR
jgi:hypothetical protein